MKKSLNNSLIAITMGDPAGIGPEIIVKAYAQQPELMRQTFVVGSLKILQNSLELLNIPMSVQEIREEDFNSLAHWPEGVIPVLRNFTPCEEVIVGQVQALAGKVAAECIEMATDLHLREKIVALVTAPIHKEALQLAGYTFPGHTEMLQSLCARFLECDISDLPVRMMLMNDELRTVLLSIHVSLRQAIEAVQFDHILQTLEICHESMFKILNRVPHIAVAGLNPHAGEGGLMGREEIDIIQPAVTQANLRGLNVSGPYPPDTIYMKARQLAITATPIDLVLAMYHDQGLIPIKYLGVDTGVNVTLGLPIIRTSPDHGTAFDIAGMGKADCSSLLQAVRVARQLTQLSAAT